MDVPQLKRLAGLVRGLLEQHDVSVGHSQSLDLIAALPGLRNWPEVSAFPDRVAACELNANSTGRLAHRLRSKHAVEFSSQRLVEALSPPGTTDNAAAPQVWPSGPASGVYVTTSQGAINALLRRYEDATDGELVYAEAAGSDWEGAIDLGEYGLSSNGLARVPSGTLIVVGPLELNQESWANSGNKLEWACMRAMYEGHRVAVLINTPQPALMFKDIELALRQVAPPKDDGYLMLAGVVSDDGELRRRVPFVQGVDLPAAGSTRAPTDALPVGVIELLAERLKQHSTGVLGPQLMRLGGALGYRANRCGPTAHRDGRSGRSNQGSQPRNACQGHDGYRRREGHAVHDQCGERLRSRVPTHAGKPCLHRLERAPQVHG